MKQDLEVLKKGFENTLKNIEDVKYFPTWESDSEKASFLLKGSCEDCNHLGHFFEYRGSNDVMLDKTHPGYYSCCYNRNRRDFEFEYDFDAGRFLGCNNHIDGVCCYYEKKKNDGKYTR